MIVIFFLCIKLCILHLCVSDLGYQCKIDDSSTDPAIFLIEDDRTAMNSILNTRFEILCDSFYKISTISLKEANKYDNVIHFGVPDYHDDKLPKNFVYAGNISDTNKAVCNKREKSEPEFDCHEIANLVSSSILKINDGDVYDFVQKMKIDKYYYNWKHRKSCYPFIERKTFNLTTVVLCLDLRTVPYNEVAVNIHPLKLVVRRDYCDIYFNYYKYNNRFLAVLTPKPFEVLSEYSVPTIFYETPYMFSENKTAFPNSMNVVPWRLLKYGFLKFIQTVGWQRVVIVTDDSEYSLEFENELIALFNKERMAYTVIRCEDANCEMDKIKQELYRVSAKIVIANVEEQHAQYLFENAHQITWIVRDMAANRRKKILDYNLNVFSIYLRTVNKTKDCNVDDNILTGLSSIALAYRNIANEDYAVKKKEFYRLFAAKAKEITIRKPEAIVVVNKLTWDSTYDDEEISTMYVDESGAELLTFKDPFKTGKSSDGTTHCLVTSYDYFKPCEDPLVMLLMLALLLFVVTFILIMFYFDKTSPYNDIRYHNF